MNEKEATDMMRSYRELSYARRACIRAILDVCHNHTSPEEKVETIERLINASGFTYREE